MEVLTPVFHEASGLWMPANESRPDKMYSALLKYQHDMKFMVSRLTKQQKNGVCVQAGGHIGFWPLKLAAHFRSVWTFEPEPPVFAALEINVGQEPKIEAFQFALGEHPETKTLSAFSTRTAVSTIADVRDEGNVMYEVQVLRVDDLEVDLAALVLDVEGYEPWVLRGARETIKRCRPLILCEMLARSSAEITETLAGMDYEPLLNQFNPKCRDVLFVPKEPACSTKMH